MSQSTDIQHSAMCQAVEKEKLYRMFPWRNVMFMKPTHHEGSLQERYAPQVDSKSFGFLLPLVS